jgi:hypothetical protein
LTKNNKMDEKLAKKAALEAEKSAKKAEAGMYFIEVSAVCKIHRRYLGYANTH